MYSHKYKYALHKVEHCQLMRMFPVKRGNGQKHYTLSWRRSIWFSSRADWHNVCDTPKVGGLWFSLCHCSPNGQIIFCPLVDDVLRSHVQFLVQCTKWFMLLLRISVPARVMSELFRSWWNCFMFKTGACDVYMCWPLNQQTQSQYSHQSKQNQSAVLD